MIVIHTAETEPDLSVPDTTAENLSTHMGTATGRAVSWHATVDADSVLHELPSQWTASHLRGWNSRTVGIEIGTKRDLWEQLPGDHAALLIENTARVAAWFCKTHHIPAEQVETLDQAQAGRRGLVAPATLDPTRRRGPGEGFPWEYLLARVADLLKADVIIGLGDRGTKVSDVQSRLTELGYGDLVGDIDGIAGSSFDAAVRAYEIDRGFSATGLWIPPSDAYKSPGAEKGCQRQLVSISDSVGIGGANRPDDVEAVSDRLDQLGFMRPDRSLSHCIRLFQTAHEGAESLQRVDGRVDPGGDSLAWLNAINVPRWQRMPVGSDEAGFRSRDRFERSDDRGWGTDWLADMLLAAGAFYRADYIGRNPDAPLIWINAASPLGGGEITIESGHSAGMELDIALPSKGASSRRLNVDSAAYDRDAARAMIKAFRKSGNIDVIYLNDDTLITEGICQRAPGHDDRLQVRIRPPERIEGHPVACDHKAIERRLPVGEESRGLRPLGAR